MLGIFDSHPVQYRAPVYRELQGLAPGAFHVFYATDISTRGHLDKGFGERITWDGSLLEGYPCTVLSCERGDPLRRFRSLSGKGVAKIFSDYKFTAVLQTQYLYAYDLEVLWQARRYGIPVWIRQETQDKAFRRGRFKDCVRDSLYRLLYSQVSHAFSIGNLNREHLLKHGIPASRMTPAPYCTQDRFAGMPKAELQAIRRSCRYELGIAESSTVIGFFGKLIPKKDPGLILKAISKMPEGLQKNLEVLFVGSGELESELHEQALPLKNNGVPVRFAGFVNQSKIADFYAATDILVLPSRRMGETWGLVVNEALQAGCSVVVSDAAGCAVEFAQLPYVSVFQTENVEALGDSIREILENPLPDRNWARPVMQRYSIQVTAEAIASLIRKSHATQKDKVIQA